MPNLFLRRILSHRKRALLSSAIYCALFCALNFLFCLVYSFFSHIYLYSDGFDNDSYYSTQQVSNTEGRLDLTDASLLYGLQSEYQGEFISYTGFISVDSLDSDNGLFRSSRVFYRIDNIEFPSGIKDKFAISSDSSQRTVVFDQTTYPVVGTRKISPTYNTKKRLDANGFGETKITLVVDSSKDYCKTDGFYSTIIKGNDELRKGDTMDFQKGSERNKRSEQGYQLFLPLIYVGFLVPFSACAFSFTAIIARLQKDITDEFTLYRVLGKKRLSSLNWLLGERRMERLIGFFITFVPFLFVYLFAYRFSFLSCLLYSLVELLYACLVIFLKSSRERKKIYSRKGGKR